MGIVVAARLETPGSPVWVCLQSSPWLCFLVLSGLHLPPGCPVDAMGISGQTWLDSMGVSVYMTLSQYWQLRGKKKLKSDTGSAF